jgi:hypothetical protein
MDPEVGHNDYRMWDNSLNMKLADKDIHFTLGLQLL